MAFTRERNPCVKCTTGSAIAACNGCQQMFCINHFTEHRNELSKLMDNVSLEHDSLRSDLYQETLQHPLLSRINTWEQESITKIQTAAQTARTKLQEMFTQKKKEIKPSMETLTNELQYSQQSNDYTENDIEKWNLTLRDLRDALEDWSNTVMKEDDQPESIIHLLKICDQQNPDRLSTVLSSEQVVAFSEEPSRLVEKFDKIDSELSISEENLVARRRSKMNIFSYSCVYGVNRYSSGKHTIHFLIENKGDALLFLGIITGSKKYDHSFFNSNNTSVYGWYNIQSCVVAGKSQEYDNKHALTAGDELILCVNCDEQQISLQPQDTKEIFTVDVNMEKCPFPWKVMVALPNYHDRIRIVH